MITLYHSPFTRSHLIRFALEELELPHELRRIDVSKGEHKAPAYLALNPLGQLPTLTDGGVTLCEAAAITLHLADRAAERGLAPAVGSPERAPYYHWVVFSVASELLVLSKIALHARVLPEPLRVPAVESAGRSEWAAVARALTLGVQGKQFLLGDRFSMADVLCGGALSLANVLGVLSPHPELVAYFGRVSDRPAFGRAYADAVSS
ncbi:MAG: glutathione S-transferase family protein [Polyangiaceae bacterium]